MNLSSLPLSDSKLEFVGDGGLALAGGFAGYEGGNVLGSNTLGVTGVPQFSYSTNVIGDPWPISAAVINEYTALSLPAFWRGVSFLAETLAGLPADVCQSVGNTRNRVPNHPLDWVLNDEINSLQTAVDTKAVLYQHAIVWGNGYALVERDPLGKPVAIWNIMPDRCFPFRFIGPDGSPKQYYAIGTVGTAGGLQVVPAADIIHVAGLGFNGICGYPVVQLMAQTLRVGKSAETFGDRFFSNGGHLGGVIETEKPLTPEQIETMRTQIASGYTGISNSHRWMVLQGGATAKTLTLPPESAQYLQTREFSVLDISRILGIPPHILSELGRATYNNIEALGIDLVKYSLGKWIIKSEQEFTRKLFSIGDRKAGYFIRLNVDALQRGDHVQQIDSTTKRISCGLKTINEERSLYDLPGIGEAGDVHFIPAQWQSVDRAIAGPIQPPAPSDAPSQSSFGVEHFAELLNAAGKRVGAKTSKATDNARAKMLSADTKQLTSWTAWGNVFAEQQATYATETVEPILATMKTITGKALEPAQLAKKIGDRYANELKAYYAQLTAGNEGNPPDLSAICRDTLKGLQP